MALEIKWGKSNRWYGRFRRDGQRRAIPLDVFIEGQPPITQKLSDRGDAAFERSRARAQLRYEQVLRELDSAESQETLLKRIHAARQRRSAAPTVPLKDACILWAKVHRARDLSTSTLAQVESLWARFLEFVETNQPAAVALADVEPSTAADFMSQETDRGIAAKTWNNNLKYLSAIFNALAKQASLYENPFEGIPEKDADIVGHMPFSVDQLAAIIEAAKKPEHSFIRPIIEVGICTGMRLGDCCRFRWENADLQNAFVRVKTSKTGKPAEIPMFPLLEELVRGTPRNSEYLFPECEVMYAANPDGIRYRAQRVFADAGFFDSGDKPRDGHKGDVHRVRTVGKRRACIRGFQSFRVSWVTLALNAGVPIALVQRVTSHRTVEIVLTYYFKPSREDFRRALADKLPSLFAIGTKRSSSTIVAELVRAIEGAVASLPSLERHEVYLSLARELKAQCSAF